MCPMLKTLQGSLQSQLKRFEGGGNDLKLNPCKSLKSVKRGAGTYLPSASLKQMPHLAWRQESAWLQFLRLGWKGRLVFGAMMR